MTERTLKTNGTKKIGRPQKGFEAYRRKALEQEPEGFKEFMDHIFASIEREHGEIEFGTTDAENNWIPYNPGDYKYGKSWDMIRAQIPGKPIMYSRIAMFEASYEEYKDEFRRRQQAIAFN